MILNTVVCIIFYGGWSGSTELVSNVSFASFVLTAWLLARKGPANLTDHRNCHVVLHAILSGTASSTYGREDPCAKKEAFTHSRVLCVGTGPLSQKCRLSFEQCPAIWVCLRELHKLSQEEYRAVGSKVFSVNGRWTTRDFLLLSGTQPSQSKDSRVTSDVQRLF